MTTKRIAFVTGTRADYGKLKPLIAEADRNPMLEVHIFVTGMHLIDLYGSTWIEVEKSGVGRLHLFTNQQVGDSQSTILGNTVLGFANFINAIDPDLVVIHGDRVEALACAASATLGNVLVAHVEGGEISGTIDETLRHAITKLSHIHLVANESAKKLVEQLGERLDSIHVIGSPDIDIMNRQDLPTLIETKERYKIPFNDYGILLYHPVTTDLEKTRADIEEIVDKIIESSFPMIVVLPNNDPGSELILQAYSKFKEIRHVKIFPSIRFENFLVLLKNCRVLIGNSSAGIREAPHYGVPSINIGSRQTGRLAPKSVLHLTDPSKLDLSDQGIDSLNLVAEQQWQYGSGNSAKSFAILLKDDNFWNIPIQKRIRNVVESIEIS